MIFKVLSNPNHSMILWSSMASSPMSRGDGSADLRFWLLYPQENRRFP